MSCAHRLTLAALRCSWVSMCAQASASVSSAGMPHMAQLWLSALISPSSADAAAAVAADDVGCAAIAARLDFGAADHSSPYVRPTASGWRPQTTESKGYLNDWQGSKGGFQQR